MVKLSVIVPVYNVEKYVGRCLDSLINQTIEDIEIIVVNDGSPDESQKVIDYYKKKYPKAIKSYIKKNGGLSDARNFGLKKAKGEYIAFLDSDDFVEHEMYKSMYIKAKDGGFDVVVCDLMYIFESYSKKAFSNIKNDIFDKEKIKKSMINIYPSVWNKIYHRSLFDNEVFFKKGVWYEDVEFLYKLLPHIQSIGVVNKPFVNYFQREGAITSTYNNKILDYIDNWNGIIEHYINNGIYRCYEKELEYCYVRYLYATLIKNAIRSKNIDLYKEVAQKAIKNVKDHFPNYKKNKYFYFSGIKGIYLLLFSKYTSHFIALLIKRNLV